MAKYYRSLYGLQRRSTGLDWILMLLSPIVGLAEIGVLLCLRRLLMYLSGF